jgi:hypothetical protein
MRGFMRAEHGTSAMRRHAAAPVVAVVHAERFLAGFSAEGLVADFDEEIGPRFEQALHGIAPGGEVFEADEGACGC